MPALPRRRRRPLLRAAIALLLAATAASCDPATPGSELGVPVNVGAGPDAETQLVAHTLAALLIAEGLDGQVEVFDQLVEARRALEIGALEALPGYSGAAWLEVLDRPSPPSDAQVSVAQVRQFDLRNGIEWLAPDFSGTGVDATPANATFALVVSTPPFVFDPAAPDVSAPSTISQLASHLAEFPDAGLCIDESFARRNDGALALFDAYDINPEREIVAAAPAAAIAGVSQGACVAGLTTATDGLAWGANLRPLLDDRGVFPAFVVAVQVPSSVREERPEIIDAISPFRIHMTTALLGGHNARVIAGEPFARVGGDLAAELRRRAGRAVL